MPTVSVIIPSYNHALYIEEAIQSVLKQSFSDFELIIIDDASHDDSWEKIQRFNDPRIHTRRHSKNQGASQTINEGLALAKGDYLSILNSDDSYHPQRLETLLALNKDFIATNLNLWDAHSKPNNSKESDWINWFEQLKQHYTETTDFLATLLKGNFLITTSNFFFSQKLYQQLKGFKDLRYVHDYEFAIRALFTDCKVAYCQEKLLYYRLHNSNTIREAPLSAIQENVNLLLSLAQTFSEKLASKPHYLTHLAQHLTELYKYNNEEWATKIHHQLVDKENELFRLIHDRDKWIEERNGWIDERDKHNKVLDKQIKAYAQALDTLETQLHAQQSLIDQQQTLIEEQKTWVSDRDGWIAERDEIIKKQQVWLHDRDQWISERDQIITELSNEVALLRNSHSYRLGQLFCTPAQPLKRIIKGGNYA